MAEENTGQEFRLKNRKEIKNCLVKEVDQNELISNSAKRIL